MIVAGIYDFTNWKEAFIRYLEAEGKKSSVAKDYAGRIERILKEESITVQALSCEIDRWIEEYKTGKYKSINQKSHYAPSCALLKFKAFVPTLCKPHFPKSPDPMDILTGKYPADLIY